MQTAPRNAPPQDPPFPLSRVAGLACLALTALGGLALLLAVLTPLALTGLAGFAFTQTLMTSAHAQTKSATPVSHVSRTMNILLSKPGGPADWPAYTPSNLTVPANSLVTLTIRNYDLGDTPLPATSPYDVVQGIQGSATMDGHPYVALDPTRVAHTFTILALHLNVPIPGDGAPGAAFVTVTFTFRTGAAGVYMWQCFAPCGDGPAGDSGSMETIGDMMGYLIVQG
jgi:hypothetical protein